MSTPTLDRQQLLSILNDLKKVVTVGRTQSYCVALVNPDLTKDLFLTVEPSVVPEHLTLTVSLTSEFHYSEWPVRLKTTLDLLENLGALRVKTGLDEITIRNRQRDKISTFLKAQTQS